MKINDINWNEIQKYYDDGHFWNDLKIRFGLNDRTIGKGIKLGLFITRSKSDSMKLSAKLNPRKMSDETKMKISISRKRFLLENPDKVPYLLNHSSRESYPEKYFIEVFEKEGIVIQKKFRIHTYELDFAIIESKIDIEIDGSQHYLDEKIVESDKRRTKYLENSGWDIIRINWAEYQKLNLEGKRKFINELKKYINGLISDKPTIEYRVFKKGKNLCNCGNQKWNKSNKCHDCYKKSYSEKPPYDQLLKEINELGYCGTGRKYKVSDNAIRKWIKYYNKNKEL